MTAPLAASAAEIARRLSWPALGPRHGNYRDGGRLDQTMALRAGIRELVRESRELLEHIE